MVVFVLMFIRRNHILVVLSNRSSQYHRSTSFSTFPLAFLSATFVSSSLHLFVGLSASSLIFPDIPKQIDSAIDSPIDNAIENPTDRQIVIPIVSHTVDN